MPIASPFLSSPFPLFFLSSLFFFLLFSFQIPRVLQPSKHPPRSATGGRGEGFRIASWVGGQRLDIGPILIGYQANRAIVLRLML